MKRTISGGILGFFTDALWLMATVIFIIVGLTASAQTSARVGYADADYIFEQMPDSKQIESSLKATSDQLNTVIAAKDDEWRKKFSEYAANQGTMLDAVRDNILNEIEQLQENVKKLKEDSQGELQRKQQQLLIPAYQKIKKAIAEVAKENGYTFILSPRVGGSALVVYADEKDNVSDLVLKKLGVTPPPPVSKTEKPNE
jgi:outer membrane protein